MSYSNFDNRAVHDLSTLHKLTRNNMWPGNNQPFFPIIPLIIPTGTEIWFVGDEPPDGFLVEDGSTLDRNEYPELWEHAQQSGALASSQGSKQLGEFGPGNGSSTFTLPNLLSGNRFVRAGTNVGNTQGDAIRNIQGNIRTLRGTFRGEVTSGAFRSWDNQRESQRDSSGTKHRNLEIDASRVVPTANENRPRCVVRLPCIKY